MGCEPAGLRSLRRGLRFPPFDEAARGAANTIDMAEQSLASLLRSGPQPLEAVQVPVTDHDGNEDLVVVGSEVVDAGVRDRSGVPSEIGDPGPGHGEVPNLPLDRRHYRLRVDREREGRQVSVEEMMEVLVGGDAGHDSTAGRIGEEPARVVVRDSRRELLQ